MKLIKIYGERNTNTNYLRELINLNLEVGEIPGVVPKAMRRIQTYLPAKNGLRDLYFGLTYHRNLGWKHALVKDPLYISKFALVKNNDVHFITLTKNPYSWLLSLFRRPYHQYYKVKPDFETFLEMEWKTVRRENIRQTVANPIELWNIKNRGYLELQPLNTLNLTTESIFHDVESVLLQISTKFSINYLTSHFINFDHSTKYESRNSEYYRDFYTNERWRPEISDSAISLINNHLDADLMEQFGYKYLRGGSDISDPEGEMRQ